MSLATNRYGRSTFTEADAAVAAAALLCGYGVRARLSRDGALFDIPDEVPLRNLRGAARCRVLRRNLHRPRFEAARAQLTRVVGLMQLVGDHDGQIVAPAA